MSVHVQPVWILNVQIKKKQKTDQTQLILFNPTFNKQSMSPEVRIVCSTLSSWEQILPRIQRWITVVGSDLFPAHVYMPSSHIPLLTVCLHASHMWCLHVKRIRMAVKAQSSHGHRSLCHRLVHNSFPVTLSCRGGRREAPACRLRQEGSAADGRWEGFMFTCWILKARLITVFTCRGSAVTAEINRAVDRVISAQTESSRFIQRRCTTPWQHQQLRVNQDRDPSLNWSNTGSAQHQQLNVQHCREPHTQTNVTAQKSQTYNISQD